MKARLALASALVVAAALGSLPAHAGTVTVNFGLSAGAHAPTEVCSVSVPSGSNGVALLDGAVTAHCIVSYSLDYRYGEPVVRCIDQICGWPDEPYTTAGLWWMMYVNGNFSGAGVAGYRPAEGDRLAFSYSDWLLPCAVTGCDW